MRDRSIRHYSLGLRLIVASLALAATGLLAASLAGQSPLLVNAAAIGGLGLAVLALPQRGHRTVSRPDAEQGSEALARV
jgi:hypothetical protein